MDHVSGFAAAKIIAGMKHEKPWIIGRLKHRQLISSPGKIQRFTEGSHMPLFTSYFMPFIATCVGRGCLPAPE